MSLARLNLPSRQGAEFRIMKDVHEGFGHIDRHHTRHVVPPGYRCVRTHPGQDYNLAAVDLECASTSFAVTSRPSRSDR